MDGKGRGIARDILKNKSIFKTLQKNGNKVATIYKAGTLVYILAITVLKDTGQTQS